MSKLEALVSFLNESVKPDDVIIRMLCEMKGNYLPKDPAIIHNAIFQLKRDPEFSELLKQFSFDEAGMNPYSELLDRVLFRLEASTLLGTLNPMYEKYELSSESKEQLLSKVSNKFKNNEEVLRMMGSRFETLVMN